MVRPSEGLDRSLVNARRGIIHVEDLQSHADPRRAPLPARDVESSGTGRGRRRLDLPGRRCVAHALHARGRDHPGQLREAQVPGSSDAGSFGPSTARATPTSWRDKLITVTGERRHVIALDPATGELLWSFTEPNTHRYEYSMRKGYGKGVAYAEVDGRGVVFITTPGFFLHALDAETGQPLENWGEPDASSGLPQTGGVDLVADLIEGWGPWERWQDGAVRSVPGHPAGDRLHHVSSPPIVVNGVGGRRQLRRAGLQPDAHRERARRHPGLRRAHRATSSGSST